MTRRRGGRRTFWASLCLLVLGVGGAVALAACLAQPGRPGEGRPGPAAAPVVRQTPRMADMPKEVTNPVAGTRRLKVGGADGFYVVINPDGSSVLEGPGGQRTPLAGAGELSQPRPPGVVDRVGKGLKPPVPPKKKEVGQLVVCDLGVIDVPTDSVITFVGRDKVVTHDPSGASVVYHVGGGVERRGRAERGQEEAASSPTKKE